jgi:outer membrane lipoprotein-sorting protein
MLGAAATAMAVCLSGATPASAQTEPADRTPLAEEVFQNVQVFQGVPADELMAAMGYFSNALSANCTYCHVGGGGGGWDQYAVDIPTKERARQMVRMMNEINRTYFGERRVVTCVSCHNGSNRPKTAMSIAAVYGLEPTDEPDTLPAQIPGMPSADEVLDTYVQALGGSERLAALTSFVATGTHLGFAEAEAVPVEIFARGPNQRTTVIHNLGGDTTTAYDGRAGWIAMPATDSPLPLRPLTGGELEGARLDADLSFPAGIKQALDNWRGTFPTVIDDRDVLVIQGRSAGNSPVKLYFDDETGLLTRMVRYADTPVGPNPTQIDYADYREVAGVKMPFSWTMTWQSGRSAFELTDVQPNVSVDPAVFGRPAAP